MTDFIRLGQNVVGDDYKVGFGKYKGRELKDVPASYLMWMIDQEWLINYLNIGKYILMNTSMLNKEAEEEESQYD